MSAKKKPTPGTPIPDHKKAAGPYTKQAVEKARQMSKGHKRK